MANKPTKITLGKRPETFVKLVTFPMLDGTTGCMEVQYIYRTRREHAEFIDGIQASIEAKAKVESERFKAKIDGGEEVPSLKQSDIVAYQVETSVETIMGSVKGWNLDIPFDREAVEQLVDELPAAVAAIVSGYREALVEGRLGN